MIFSPADDCSIHKLENSRLSFNSSTFSACVSFCIGFASSSQLLTFETSSSLVSVLIASFWQENKMSVTAQRMGCDKNNFLIKIV